MRYRNTDDHYGSIAMTLHWLIFVLVLGLIVAGFTMKNLADSPLKFKLYDLHESTGLTVLALMVIRVWWASINIGVALPANTLASERWAARTVQCLMCLGLFVMPLSGWIMSTAAGFAPNVWNLGVLPAPFITKNEGLSHFLSSVHDITAWAMIALVVIHTLAAMKHYYFNKDNVMQSMLPARKNTGKSQL